MQVTVCAELENRIRLSLYTLHCGQFNFQDALSSKSRQSSRFNKFGQFLPKPNMGLPNFTFLQQPQESRCTTLHVPLKDLPTVWPLPLLHESLVKDAWIYIFCLAKSFRLGIKKNTFCESIIRAGNPRARLQRPAVCGRPGHFCQLRKFLAKQLWLGERNPQYDMEPRLPYTALL